MTNRFLGAVGVALLAGALTAAPAFAVSILSNGGFETGDFTGWTVTDQAGGTGSFYIDNDTVTPISGHGSVGPASGSYYAVSDQTGPGAHALSQTFTVGSVSSALLTFDMFVNDWDSGPIVNPAGLDWTAGLNQHARVDLLADGAGAFDTGAGVLANFYLGVDGGNNPNPYTTYSFDLTPYLVGGAGTYTLRFAEVDNALWFNQGVDNVLLDVTPVPEPGTLALMGSGLLGLALWRRRKNA